MVAFHLRCTRTQAVGCGRNKKILNLLVEILQLAIRIFLRQASCIKVAHMHF